MWESIGDGIQLVFGGDEPLHPLSLAQIAARAIAIYMGGIIILRLGKSRMINRATIVDVLLAFVIGSLLSRGITGRASLSGTLVACVALVGLHWLITLIAYYHHGFGTLIKGHYAPLIKDGAILWENLRKSHISHHDLIEELRLNAHVEDPALVYAAYKERSGGVSVLLKHADEAPHV